MTENATDGAIGDDFASAGPIKRAVRRTASTRAISRLYSVVQEPLDKLVYRATRERTTLTTMLSGLDLIMLTTTGAKTGKPRTLPLFALRDGPRWIVIASNYGRTRHPAWYGNLRAQPRAEVKFAGDTQRVEARELSGADRDRFYERATEFSPNFSSYPDWAKREIPVLALDPA